MMKSIWRSNKEEEMRSISHNVETSTFVAVDTEYPGCLKPTALDANDQDRYSNMKYNVDNTKIIQLGFTLFNGDGLNRTWEINFSDFDENSDAKNDKSIAFLKRNCLDFDRIRAEGVSIEEFFKDFIQILGHDDDNKKKKLIWVTFDGSYDMAYLLKGLTGGKPLPDTLKQFEETIQTVFGHVLDVKKLTGMYTNLGTHLGLQRIADELQVSREGEAHHAGSDSQLTSLVCIEIASISREGNQKKDQQHQHPMVPQQHDYNERRMLVEAQHLQDHQLMMHQQNFKRMQLFEAHHPPDFMMTRCYVPRPQPRPRPIFTAYPSFGGYILASPVPRMNYV